MTYWDDMALRVPEDPIEYDGRRFTRSDRENAPIALYRQSGSILHGAFDGGGVEYGMLCGQVHPNGWIRFGYAMIEAGGQAVIGECLSEPRIDQHGQIHLREVWTRFRPHHDNGISFLKEIR